MQASPLANAVTASKRKLYFAGLRIFATWVVVGVVLALFIELSLQEWAQKPEQYQANHVEQPQQQSDVSVQAPVQVLELVALPQLPPELQVSKAEDQVAKSSEQNTESKSHALAEAPEVAEVFDATAKHFVEQGQQFLNNAEADIQIAFALPDAPSARNKTLGVLRECVGVRLALLNAKGDAVLEYEEAPTALSPYGRELSGSLQSALLSDEHTTAYQWQKRYGIAAKVVRVYPLEFDARWLGVLSTSLLEVHAKPNQTLQVNGRLRMQGSALVLDELKVNGERVAKKLIMARAC